MGITGPPIPVEITPEIIALRRYAVQGQNVLTSWDNDLKKVTKFKMIKATPGGAYPINVTPKVNDLGRFAVHEHKKKECTNLKFNKVWRLECKGAGCGRVQLLSNVGSCGWREE